MMRSLGFKFLVMGVLAVLLLVPLGGIRGLVQERQRTRDAAVQEIARGSGLSQTVTGPVLVLPTHHSVQEWVEDPRSRERRLQERDVIELQYVLPEKFDASTRLATERRQRGIHEARLYRGTVHLSARFAMPARDPALRYGRPWLAVGIADVRGIGAGLAVRANDGVLTVEPGTGTGLLANGIRALLPEGAATMDANAWQVEVDLPLQGTSEFHVVPVGRDSTLAIASDWPHPSFNGDLLPVSREVGEQGFEARWQTSFFATELPQRVQACAREPACRGLQAPTWGVSFIDPVDQYLRTDRAIKYGLLIITLTFGGFFLCELLLKRSLHPVQYGLVGLSLAFFFLLLLSFAEHIGFGAAYVLSALASVGLLGSYVGSVLAGRQRGLVFAACLSALYALLYVLLGSEDYALLMGSILLFAALSLFMLVTRRIDWGRVGVANDAMPGKDQ